MKLPNFKLPKLPAVNLVHIHLPAIRLGSVRVAANFVWRRIPKRFRLPRWLFNPYNAAMIILFVIIGISGLVWNNQRRADSETANKFSSPSFKNGGTLSTQFTCDGDNLSPEFTIGNIPAETKSLAFIIEDKNLDTKLYKDSAYQAHLMVWSIPSETKKFTQGIRPPGTIGRNIFGNFSYGGPCPPEGETHKYVFTLYFIAKDSLVITSDAGLAEAKKTIEDNSIGKSKLTASYTRIKKK